MSKASKGSEFERELCKKLSRWWTNGERDDVYWRSSQSGGRATQRMKKGQTTYGSYGDIASVDPIGEPLLKFFTIELKRGSTYSCAGDLLDFKEDNSKHPWAACLLQAIRSHRHAGSKTWMLICRRDHRQAIVYLESAVFKLLGGRVKGVSVPAISFRLTLKGQGKMIDRVHFIGIPLDTFLQGISPKQIIEHL